MTKNGNPQIDIINGGQRRNNDEWDLHAYDTMSLIDITELKGFGRGSVKNL